MARFTEHIPGTFSFIDLMSPDVDASSAFYCGVFGWDAVDQHALDGTKVYTMFLKDGASVAGLGGQPDGMAGPPVWNSYVAIADVDRSTALVPAAGGRVVLPPTDVMDAGRMAIFAAPDGSHVAAWQPGTHAGAELANEHATWSWNELLSRDVEAARSFYTAVFGWTYGEMDLGPMGTYALATVGEHQMAGLMAMPDAAPAYVPSYWGVYFTTDDIEATIAAITRMGGRLTSEKAATPGVGTMATAQDPLGGTFSLIMPEASGG